MVRRSLAVACAFAALAAVTLRAQEAGQHPDLPKGIEFVTSVEGITELALDNGLHVLLFPDPSKPTVTVNMTYFVGSRHEGYGEAGMAHLLEHMLFKGTPTHPQIPKALQARGADYNGTTWLDRTNYYETLPATEENLEFAIKLEADRMVNSFVKAEDLTSEMTVVRNEFEQGENTPAYILQQRMMAAAYEWHNYGKTTIGNRADIERVPIENLQDFYRRYYQPDNGVLIIAGRFEPMKALEYVAKYFSPIPEPDRELPNTYTEEPAQDGERIVTLRRVGEVAIVGAMYHIPAGPHPDYVAIDILENILSDSPSGRLYKALVETKKAANVYGSAYALHDPGMLYEMAEVASGNDPQIVLDLMLEVLNEVRDEGVTQEEVEQAKVRLLKIRELAANSSSDLAIQLSEWAAQGDWRLYFLYRDRLEAATLDDVNRVAKTYLLEDNRTVGIFAPTKNPERISVPETPSLAEMIGDYKGREDLAAGEAFDPSPENIESRLERPDLGGLDVALLPKKTRGGAVQVALTLRYGNVENLSGLATAAELLPDLMRRGTKDMTHEQLQQALDKNLAQLHVVGRPGEATFRIETRREFLPEVLDIIGKILREPTLPEQEFELLKQEQLAALEEQLTDPSALATSQVSKHLNPYEPGDPRYVASPEEDIERLRALKLSDMKKLYGEYLNGEHGELAIVGDFDPKEIVPQLETILAGWKSKKSYARLERIVDESAEGGIDSILTPDKKNATYFAGLAIPISDEHEDFPALALGNYILGESALSSRLGDRVRQREGLSYGIGSQLNASAVDDRTTFSIYAISNPDNVEKVTAAVREEIDRLLKEGIEPDELEAAKGGYLQALQLARAEDSTLTATLRENLLAGRTMEFYADLEQEIASLTAEEVVEALRRHVDPGKLYVVRAGDFKTAETKSE